tara:strand:+ start:2287 stop:2499 length:213 start_codon:yes stop_codon:yes gene_type:complete
MKTIKGKKVGRKKKPVYNSIFGDYDDKNLDEKVMTIPKIINEDIGWEMQLGMKRTSLSYETQYLQSKFTR